MAIQNEPQSLILAKLDHVLWVKYFPSDVLVQVAFRVANVAAN